MLGPALLRCSLCCTEVACSPVRVAKCEECFGRRLVAKLVNDPLPLPDRLTPVLSNYGDLGELTVETYVARMISAALMYNLLGFRQVTLVTIGTTQLSVHCG